MEWEELARLAESLTPISTMAAALPSMARVSRHRCRNMRSWVWFPLPPVQDSVETMIAPRKPALPPSERAYLRSEHARRDIWLAFTFLTALALSVAACVYFFGQGQTLLFPDALVQWTLRVASSLARRTSILRNWAIASCLCPLSRRPRRLERFPVEDGPGGQHPRDARLHRDGALRVPYRARFDAQGLDKLPLS